MAGGRREHGALEAELLGILRSRSEPVAAADLVAACGEPRPAGTTVLTVLDRLRAKGLVERQQLSPRRVRWLAAPAAFVDPSEALSRLSGADREAVLLKFAGNLDAADVDFLRSAVARRDPR